MHTDQSLLEHHQEVIDQIDDLFIRLMEEEDEQNGMKICYVIGEILDRSYTEDELPQGIAYITNHYKETIEGLDDLSPDDFEQMVQMYRAEQGVSKITSLMQAEHDEDEDDETTSLHELLEDIEGADAEEAVELAKSVAFSLAHNEHEAQELLDEIQESIDARKQQDRKK
jgi:hypothetical protein